MNGVVSSQESILNHFVLCDEKVETIVLIDIHSPREPKTLLQIQDGHEWCGLFCATQGTASTCCFFILDGFVPEVIKNRERTQSNDQWYQSHPSQKYGC